MNPYLELKEKVQGFYPELEIRLEEPMAKHTTFRIGGPVKAMALPKSLAQCVILVQMANRLGLVPQFIGNGSNLLVHDDGADVLVIKVAEGMDSVSVEDNQIVAEAGISLARLAQVALQEGLTGLEFAHGIPGTLGGAITMNAGAYGGEMSMVVEQVTYLTAMGQMAVASGEDLDFAYRHSGFSDGTRLILGATLGLRWGAQEEIQAKMEDLSRQRREKQPLDRPNAGSTFKRPEGQFAAALIDQCGLKGASVGGAQVSPKHAGFVVNTGGATCADVLALVTQIKETVKAQTDVDLELEIKLLGM